MVIRVHFFVSGEKVCIITEASNVLERLKILRKRLQQN